MATSSWLVAALPPVVWTAGARAQVADHLQCYKVKDLSIVLRGTVDLDNALFPPASTGCKISKAALYCIGTQEENPNVLKLTTADHAASVLGRARDPGSHLLRGLVSEAARPPRSDRHRPVRHPRPVEAEDGHSVYAGEPGGVVLRRRHPRRRRGLRRLEPGRADLCQPGIRSGTLGCAPGCRFDTSQCIPAAWSVNFFDASVLTLSKTATATARAVRGGP